MKRMIKVLAVAALVAVILAASMAPALARRHSGGIPVSTTRPCEVHLDATRAQNERGAHFEERPESPVALCWVVLPTHDE